MSMPTGRLQPADRQRAQGLRLAYDLRRAGQLDEVAAICRRLVETEPAAQLELARL
jgi:hypothetical protein